MIPGRRALVVAVDEYLDAGLGRLRAASQDAVELADILSQPDRGAFDVTVLRNPGSHEVRVAVEDFFAESEAGELLVVHFSCHGLKSASGELFLAASDTRPARLASTAVPADFVNRQMADCAAQRIALFLDCCYGGAFPRGMVVRGSTDVHVKEAFASSEAVDGGRGRVVVTASSAVQYAFEDGDLTPGAPPAPSVFTGALVEGLRTGDADRDGDGWVGLQELFGYVSQRVRASTSHQTPHLWTFGSQGDLLLARSGRRRVVPQEPPAALVAATRDPLTSTRLGVALELHDMLIGDDLPRALGAWNLLRSMEADDSHRVGAAVASALAAAAPRVVPGTLDLIAPPPDLRVSAEVEVDGPPLARELRAVSAPSWLHVELDGSRVAVTASADADDVRSTALVLAGPTGEVTVHVSVRSEASPTVVAPVRQSGSEPAVSAAPPSGSAVSAPRKHGDRDRSGWRSVGLLVASVVVGIGGAVAWTRVAPDDYELWLDMAVAGLLPALIGVTATVAAIVRPRVAPVALGAAIGAALVVVRVLIDAYYEWVASEVAYRVAATAVVVQVVLLSLAVARMGPGRPAARLRRIGPASAVLLVGGTACEILNLVGAGSPDESLLASAGKYVVLAAVQVVVAWLILVRLDGARDVALVTAIVVQLVLAAAVLVYFAARYGWEGFGFTVLGGVLISVGIILAARRDGASWAEASSAPGAGQAVREVGRSGS